MRPTIICLTPVRNEAWVLDRFLKAASLWADYIIIADQMSTDGSREIARSFPKVILIDNNSEDFNEPERQKLLISEARKIEGQRLLIALDADEMFTPNFLYSDDWRKLINSNPGTVFRFQWANLAPNLEYFWLGHYFSWGYMDDGYEHNYNFPLHNYRIPLPENSLYVEINEIKVIHFQFTDWERMKSKQRWYQCLEIINNPNKSAVEIYRQYHYMNVINKADMLIFPNEWVVEYLKYDINILEIKRDTKVWYDEQVLRLFNIFGVNRFRKIDIWDVDWVRIGRLWNYDGCILFTNPQTVFDKLIISWLKVSQSRINIRFFRRIDRAIKYLFKF